MYNKETMKLNNKTNAKRISNFDKSFKKFHQKTIKYYGNEFAFAA